MQPPNPKHIVFIGASVRSALDSWANTPQKGLGKPQSDTSVSAIDIFGDIDTLGGCSHWHHLKSDARIAEQLKSVPDGPVVPVGGVESFVDELDAISLSRPLAGASTRTFRLLRDPSTVDSIAARCGFHRPERTVAKPHHSGDWLLKRVASTGGLGVIRVGDGGTPTANEDDYFERFTKGRTFGACFIASNREVRLIGVATGLRGLGRPMPFIYQGSIATDASSSLNSCSQNRQRICDLGAEIAACSGIVGCFGADFIAAPDGRLWLLEINPRWTAAMELFEGKGSVMREHVRVFACPDSNISLEYGAPAIKGKRILYASRSLYFEREQIEMALDPGVRLADIPRDGTTIDRGHPVCTVIAEASSSRDVAQKLASAKRRINI